MVLISRLSEELCFLCSELHSFPPSHWFFDKGGGRRWRGPNQSASFGGGTLRAQRPTEVTPGASYSALRRLLMAFWPVFTPPHGSQFHNLHLNRKSCDGLCSSSGAFTPSSPAWGWGAVTINTDGSERWENRRPVPKVTPDRVLPGCRGRRRVPPLLTPAPSVLHSLHLPISSKARHRGWRH